MGVTTTVLVVGGVFGVTIGTWFIRSPKRMEIYGGLIALLFGVSCSFFLGVFTSLGRPLEKANLNGRSGPRFFTVKGEAVWGNDHFYWLGDEHGDNPRLWNLGDKQLPAGTGRVLISKNPDGVLSSEPFP